MKLRKLTREVILVCLFTAVLGLQLHATNSRNASAQVAKTQPRLAEDISPHDGTIEIEPTPTATPPTPTPAPTADPTQCEYYKGELNLLGWGMMEGYENPVQTYEDLPCLTNLVNELHNIADNESVYNVNWYHDDTLAWAVAEKMFGGKNGHIGDYDNGAHCNRVTMYCTESGGHHWWHHFRECKARYCLDGYWYFDSECNLVSSNEVDCEPHEAISVTYWKSTPISLLWTPEADTERDVTLAKFPLEPGNPEQWYIWKASDVTPLLVYDPKHKGEINSAFQLFGRWTFGGQRTAGLMNTSSDIRSSVVGQPWENGFEALATLDANGDGEISGTELKPLALWFDHNRDAVSQQGEVRSLHEVGINALYYTPDTQDQLTGNLTATKGFRRVVDGKERIGRSVDWLGRGTNSQFELIAERLLPYRLSEASSKTKSQDHPVEIPAQNLSAEESGIAAKAGQSPRLAGAWAWRIIAGPDKTPVKTSPQPDGYLLFAEDSKAGVLGGYSLVQTSLKKTGKASGLISMFSISGSTLQTQEGNLKLSFRSNREGTALKSTGVLSKDGKEIRGKTKLSYRENNQARLVTYHWVAEKKD